MFFCIFLVGWWFELVWNCSIVLCALLVDRVYFFALWAWRKGDQSIRRIQCRIKSMWLVIFIGRNATHVCAFLVGHSKSDKTVKLCRHYLRTRYNEKGIVSLDTLKIRMLQFFHNCFYFQIINNAFSYFMTLRKFRT